jgi:hypothetical protein
MSTAYQRHFEIFERSVNLMQMLEEFYRGVGNFYVT